MHPQSEAARDNAPPLPRNTIFEQETSQNNPQ